MDPVFTWGSGGKGRTGRDGGQAGRRGCHGDQAWPGRVRREHSEVLFTDKAFSGVAPIAVDEGGRNSIIIVTGANDLLTTEEIEAARPSIASAQILVCQLEVPLEISLAALRLAREEKVTTIFNPAPGRPDLPDELFRLSDILCPNESAPGKSF